MNPTFAAERPHLRRVQVIRRRALGVPTVTLFGPTDPRGWNPEHPLHIMVRTGEPCSPCDLLECPVAGHPCMTGLRAVSVLAALDTVLGRLPAVAREDT